MVFSVEHADGYYPCALPSADAKARDDTFFVRANFTGTAERHAVFRYNKTPVHLAVTGG